jgi:hypothetical protein
MFRRDKFVASTLAVLLSTGIAAPVALANPPAYGSRTPQPQPHYAGHDNYRQAPHHGVSTGSCNGDDVGTVLGAVAGGVIGSNAATGDQKVAGTVFGALLGGLIGNQIGRAGDPDCNGRSMSYRPAGAVYGYYPPPPPVYVAPAPRPVYVVPAPRRAYAVPYRQGHYRFEPHRDDRHGDDRRNGRGGQRGDRR